MGRIKFDPPWQRTKLCLVAIGALLVFGTGHADEPLALEDFAGLTIIDHENLDTLRGRDGDTSITVASNQTLEAMITGSEFSVGTVNSGGVSFGADAIGNFSGIGLFNIVTGSNNAVDTALGVSFNLQ
jgi:hypothetical protein